MKVYLAAAWSRREEIALVAERLKKVGVEITSKWLEEEPCPPSQMKQKFLRERAYRDLEDIDRADMIVRFTDLETQGDPFQFVRDNGNPVSALVYTESGAHFKKLLSAARMVEFGYAKARGKVLVVVGGHQNVFDYMDDVLHFNTVDDLEAHLSEE